MKHDDDFEREGYQEVTRKWKSRRHKKAPRWVIFIIALLFLGIGFFFIQNQMWYEQNGIRAEGTVTDHSRSTDSDGTKYSPIITYSTEQNRQITFTAGFSSNPKMYVEGDKVTVIYDPDNPQDNVILDWGIWNWALSALFTAFGGIFLISALKMRPKDKAL